MELTQASVTVLLKSCECYTRASDERFELRIYLTGPDVSYLLHSKQNTSLTLRPHELCLRFPSL